MANCPAGGEWLGIRFRLGTHLPRLPTGALLDHQSLVLPSAADGRFWLNSRWWEAPTYENAETFVALLAAGGVVRRDGMVELVTSGGAAEVSLRSVQRRFLQFTGLTRDAFRQIERARHAAHLLRDGASVLDVVDQAGYFDQPHLNRALRRLIGPTPADLLHGQAQLSFLYKTAPPSWA
ncbi:MAG TPA: helix-turn-helix domain-containing protein [Caulobacteraceae bacterium]|nr:helix-turn-helix domain-containing protein [Caulobacteraceae bacterium]